MANPKQPIGASNNAYRYFITAGVAMDASGDEITHALGGPGAAGEAPIPEGSAAEKEALVRRNARALGMIRQGFAFSYNPPPQNPKTHLIIYPGMAKFRDLGRLFKLEAQVRAAHGDWAGAAGSDLDVVQMGEMCVHGGSTVPKLVGNALQEVGRTDLWIRIGQLNAAQSRQAIVRMDRIARLHTPLSDVLKHEQWEYLTRLKLVLHRPNWRREFANLNLGDSTIMTQLQTMNQQTLVHGYTQYMETLTAAADRPYNKAFLDSLKPSPALLGFAVVGTPNVFFDASARAQHALLRAALALRVYRLTHGRYPNTLAQLTPAILSTPTTDPFGGDAPLRYRQAGDGYVLYSVGPDGRDDRGKAIFDPQAWRDDMRRHVNRTAQGDIVAGVNRN